VREGDTRYFIRKSRVPAARVTPPESIIVKDAVDSRVKKARWKCRHTASQIGLTMGDKGV